jgi:hypothetical protein
LAASFIYEINRLYIDEVETSLFLPATGRRGEVKIDMMHEGKEESFVGG